MLFTALERVISVAVYFSYELASHWQAGLRMPASAWVLNICMPVSALHGDRYFLTSEICLQRCQPCRAHVPRAVDPEILLGGGLK